jgi:hypothetical protein
MLTVQSRIEMNFIIMIIIHAVQKLLNTSRLKPVLYVSQPDEGQLLHSWYARLLATGFPGKLLVIYVHEPSLMTIVCRGKTIQGTWQEFRQRLEGLLRRFQFSPSFIGSELKQLDGYVVSKTQSKSILAHMNQMILQLEYDCYRFDQYQTISLDYMEDIMMDHYHQYADSPTAYVTPRIYWKNKEALA